MIGLNDDLRRLAEAGRPIRIGLVGAGQMGTDIVSQVAVMKGIDVVAVADIDVGRARTAFDIAKVDREVVKADGPELADGAVCSGHVVVTSDYRVLVDSSSVDVVVEATGNTEVGARVILRAARRGKSVASLNVETDVTVGPALGEYVRAKGALYSLAAGDEPTACKELWDFADALGFTVVAVGKGKNNPLDRHASPLDREIVREAEARGLRPEMLVEFIDGSKTMIEMAAVANATGLVPDVRGMHGPSATLDTLKNVFVPAVDGGQLSRPGVVDYAVGAIAPAVFAVVRTDQPRLREAMALRDMGPGPYYALVRPYHLCSIEVPLTCVELFVHHRAAMAPANGLVADVVAVAKRDLHTDDRLGGIGSATHYGVIEEYAKARGQRLLPIGIAQGARVVRPVAADLPLTLDDVEVSSGSVAQVRHLQEMWQSQEIGLEQFLASLDGVDA